MFIVPKNGKVIRMYRTWWANSIAGGRVSTVSPGPGGWAGWGHDGDPAPAGNGCVTGIQTLPGPAFVYTRASFQPWLSMFAVKAAKGLRAPAALGVLSGSPTSSCPQGLLWDPPPWPLACRLFTGLGHPSGLSVALSSLLRCDSCMARAGTRSPHSASSCGLRLPCQTARPPLPRRVLPKGSCRLGGCFCS